MEQSLQQSLYHFQICNFLNPIYKQNEYSSLEFKTQSQTELESERQEDIKYYASSTILPI